MGVATVWGDSALALITSHPKFAGVQEFFEGETAVCVVKEKLVMTYKKPVGNLVLIWQRRQACGVGKELWTSYPNRMLQMRVVVLP